MTRRTRRLAPLLAVAVALSLQWSPLECRAAPGIPLEVSKIYFEYNATDKDLGVHVAIDGEDWIKLKIVNPKGRTIFDVAGKAAYRHIGLTELFFEGAEPELVDVPLEEILAQFPEGKYQFKGKTLDKARLVGTGTLSYAIPDGPSVSAVVGPGDLLTIGWTAVTSSPAGFPNRPITVVGYQVIVDPFQVTVPATARKVTVPPEFVASLASGAHAFEVLAIEASGNQTLTAGSFVKP